MSAVFTAYLSDGYQIVNPVSIEAGDYLHLQLNGQTRQNGWKPLPVQLCTHDDSGRMLKQFDVSGVGSPGSALVLTRPAVARVGGMLLDYGEILPLPCSEIELFLFNPLVIVDALDTEASELARIHKTGRIYGVWKHVFRKDQIGSAHIFRIPQLKSGPTYFSAQIVSLWREVGLLGIDFKQIWGCTT